jgi:hypothetical protein
MLRPGRGIRRPQKNKPSRGHMKIAWIAPSTLTARDRWSALWRSPWTPALTLVVGLIAGPFISSAFGWQVSADTARTQARASMIELQAAYCNAQARADVRESGVQLDWRVRTDLAQRWAAMPGSIGPNPDVVRACERKLAQR